MGTTVGVSVGVASGCVCCDVGGGASSGVSSVCSFVDIFGVSVVDVVSSVASCEFDSVVVFVAIPSARSFSSVSPALPAFSDAILFAIIGFCDSVLPVEPILLATLLAKTSDIASINSSNLSPNLFSLPP